MMMGQQYDPIEASVGRWGMKLTKSTDVLFERYDQHLCASILGRGGSPVMHNQRQK